MAENSANMSKRKAATILIVWGMVVFWLVAWDRVLYSRKAEILVIENDAVRKCRIRYGQSGGRSRSEVPRMPMFDFCGAVRTDLGTFELPHTTYISVLDEPRLELKQNLQDG